MKKLPYVLCGFCCVIIVVLVSYLIAVKTELAVSREEVIQLQQEVTRIRDAQAAARKAVAETIEKEFRDFDVLTKKKRMIDEQFNLEQEWKKLEEERRRLEKELEQVWPRRQH